MGQDDSYYDHIYPIKTIYVQHLLVFDSYKYLNCSKYSQPTTAQWMIEKLSLYTGGLLIQVIFSYWLYLNTAGSSEGVDSLVINGRWTLNTGYIFILVVS